MKSGRSKSARKCSRAKKPNALATAAGRALLRAAKTARKIARMYGTPIYVCQNGKVVALKP
jgi:hypothetical protein